ncbi:hypothetical protein GFH48_03800 [Streptomyces fagopyri]|uniref:Uncharacterized protein n=1 Tax=Streptomyces fagopyri TaxID=2662397 RepID=A0A5Q0L656_9ACTN|nr:hypothetical protein [Streptomyces fagopyri]QFZ72502.1 hypothetical protein GFH48_03800 [Streptomyces fagopyri]
MSEGRAKAPGSSGGPTPKPIPRDLPDQQVTAGEDPWDITGVPTRTPGRQPDTEIADTEIADPGIPDTGIPDTDEAGTGRRGAPHSGSRRPAHPVPDEPPA